jgi:hypothetical protein
MKQCAQPFSKIYSAAVQLDPFTEDHEAFPQPIRTTSVTLSLIRQSSRLVAPVYGYVQSGNKAKSGGFQNLFPPLLLHILKTIVKKRSSNRLRTLGEYKACSLVVKRLLTRELVAELGSDYYPCVDHTDEKDLSGRLGPAHP